MRIEPLASDPQAMRLILHHMCVLHFGQLCFSGKPHSPYFSSMPNRSTIHTDTVTYQQIVSKQNNQTKQTLSGFCARWPQDHAGLIAVDVIDTRLTPARLTPAGERRVNRAGTTSIAVVTHPHTHTDTENPLAAYINGTRRSERIAYTDRTIHPNHAVLPVPCSRHALRAGRQVCSVWCTHRQPTHQPPLPLPSQCSASCCRRSPFVPQSAPPTAPWRRTTCRPSVRPVWASPSS